MDNVRGECGDVWAGSPSEPTSCGLPILWVTRGISTQLTALVRGERHHEADRFISRLLDAAAPRGSRFISQSAYAFVRAGGRGGRMTRWWKCDLQVATPGEPRFVRPAHWDLSSAAGREAAADEYIKAAADAGLEVLGLADHNSVEWVDEMVRAGRQRGIVVFPGFELTTASGSDGAHLVVLGPPEAGATRMSAALHASGFSSDHPMFDPARPSEPAPSEMTMPQVLDKLPADMLAFAPHAFTDNGIASAKTVKGSLRWKALHHPRLAAIDVGDASTLQNEESWRGKFLRRELADFPCLPGLPFVSTSDSYSLGSLGSRFTWIRMEEPTVEGLRQAFLDHETRIVCHWDPRFHGTENTPNDVSHAYVRKLSLASLPTCSGTLEVEFDPRLSVLIGGRGAGKSTVVAGLRLLYSDLESLPDTTRGEAQQLRSAIFGDATLDAVHVLPHSGEEQQATWALAAGSSTRRGDGRATPTDFRVRVISQKELFERAANSADNPYATSRNLLALVDGAIAGGTGLGLTSTESFVSTAEEARNRWVAAIRQYESERTAVAQRPLIEERLGELERQVDAFDSDESRARRQQNDELIGQGEEYVRSLTSIRAAVEGLASDVSTRLVDDQSAEPGTSSGASSAGEGRLYVDRLMAVRAHLSAETTQRLTEALEQVASVDDERRQSAWQMAVDRAAADHRLYVQELADLGLDPQAYERVRAQLQDQRALLRDLVTREAGIPGLLEEADRAWNDLMDIHEARRSERRALLNEVSQRSGMLRFELVEHADLNSWSMAVRGLLSLRSDGFLEEVPELARWLWEDQGRRGERLRLWKEACVSGDFDRLAREARLRAAWATRLRTLDPLVRTRLAAEMADDVVSMDFLRENADPGESSGWQPLTTGSPGQRSAAMLGFVLHQGDEPLVLDQPEDDLDTEWISELVVRQLRLSRWVRQVIVVTHNANIPVNADAERVIVLENGKVGIKVRTTGDLETDQVRTHCGPLENDLVRADIQQIMEGGVEAFVRRERRYNNELNTYRAALQQLASPTG